MAKGFKYGVVITGDASGAVKATKLTAAELRKLNSTTKKSRQQNEKFRKQVKKSNSGLLSHKTAILGAAAALTGYFAKLSFGEIDKIAKTSDKLGVATEKLIGLRHAADLTGVSQEKLDSSFERMVKRVGEAELGYGAAKTTLEGLGLANEEFYKLKPDEQFEKISDAVNGLDSQQKKVAASAALFGREGVSLVNTMKLGSKGLKEMAKEAEIAGVAINRIDAAKVEAANDSISRSQLLFKGLTQQLTVEFAPIVEAVAQELFNTAEESGGMGEAVSEAFGAGVTAIDTFVQGLRLVEVGYKGLQLASAKSWSTILSAIKAADQALTEYLNKLPGFLGGGSYAESDLVDGLARSLEATVSELSGEFNKLISDSIANPKPFETFISNVQRRSTEAAKAVAKANDKVVESNEVVVKSSEDDVVEASKNISNGISAAFDTEVFGEWSEVVKEGINEISKQLDELVEGFDFSGEAGAWVQGVVNGANKYQESRDAGYRENSAQADGFFTGLGTVVGGMFGSEELGAAIGDAIYTPRSSFVETGKETQFNIVGGRVEGAETVTNRTRQTGGLFQSAGTEDSQLHHGGLLITDENQYLTPANDQIDNILVDVQRRIVGSFSELGVEVSRSIFDNVNLENLSIDLSSQESIAEFVKNISGKYIRSVNESQSENSGYFQYLGEASQDYNAFSLRTYENEIGDTGVIAITMDELVSAAETQAQLVRDYADDSTLYEESLRRIRVNFAFLGIEVPKTEEALAELALSLGGTGEAANVLTGLTSDFDTVFSRNGQFNELITAILQQDIDSKAAGKAANKNTFNSIITAALEEDANKKAFAEIVGAMLTQGAEEQANTFGEAAGEFGELLQDSLLDALESQLDMAESQLDEIQDKEREAHKLTVDRYNAAISGEQKLQDFLFNLNLGSNSTLTPLEKLALAESQFAELENAAKVDPTKVGELTQLVSTILTLGQATDASGQAQVDRFSFYNNRLAALQGGFAGEGAPGSLSLTESTGDIKTLEAQIAAQQGGSGLLSGFSSLEAAAGAYGGSRIENLLFDISQRLGAISEGAAGAAVDAVNAVLDQFTELKGVVAESADTQARALNQYDLSRVG